MNPDTRQSALTDISWLSQVKESRQPLTERYPIWVRHGVVHSGPPIPHPEKHPYCELSMISEGAAMTFVGREKMLRRAVDFFIMGTGVPHWFRATQYPVRFAAIYFLPSALIDVGPLADGLAILRRFTALQSLADRIIHPPPAVKKRLEEGFTEIIQEFKEKRFGHEIRLRTILLEMLVELIRWEQSVGRKIQCEKIPVNWEHMERALGYICDHYSDPVYARDIAAAAGISETQLKNLFRNTLGMPWTHYLKGYRIHRAAGRLSQPGTSILEIALSVGFETLSHFNASFRSVMGVSPRSYLKRAAEQKAAAAP
jgi:AraC-like DNA-binding protein